MPSTTHLCCCLGYRLRGCCLVNTWNSAPYRYSWNLSVMSHFKVKEFQFMNWIIPLTWRQTPWGICYSSPLTTPGLGIALSPNPSLLASVWRMNGDLKSAYASTGASVQSLCNVSKASCCSGLKCTLNFFFWFEAPSTFCKSSFRGLATLRKVRYKPPIIPHKT